MSSENKKFSWVELLLPVYNDLKNINEEASTTKVSQNNWDLVNGNSEFKYEDVIKKIKDIRGNEDKDDNIIIIK